MTLAKYAIQYSKWPTQDIKEFAEQRGLELDLMGPKGRPRKLTVARRRKLWIHRLHEKDKAATIRFLDFPPEIRNMVYGFLLAPQPHSRHQPYWDRFPKPYKCHSNILVTSKQVNAEAAEMLSTTFQDISMTLEITLMFHGDGPSRASYHIIVQFNGVLIGKGVQGDPNINVVWPECLRGLRELKIKVCFSQSGLCSPASASVHHEHNDGCKLTSEECKNVKSSGEMQINHTLYDLYCFLEMKNGLQHVQVSTSISTGVNNAYNHIVLSPIWAIMGLAKKSDINKMYWRPNTDLEYAIQAAAESFRKIRVLKQEAILQSELRDLRLSAIERAWSSLSFPRHGLSFDALERCRLATSVRESQGFCGFAGNDELAIAIRSIPHDLNKTEGEEVEDGSVEVAEKLKQLKEKRAARKMDVRVEAGQR